MLEIWEDPDSQEESEYPESLELLESRDHRENKDCPAGTVSTAWTEQREPPVGFIL